MRRFDEWRGSQEQVDDVLVIGVRVWLRKLFTDVHQKFSE
jgi:hypothetical protein